MIRSRAFLPPLALPPLALLFAVPAALVPAQDLPVITFTYETAQGIEEDDEEELEPTYVRHTLLTSVRQDLGDAARLTLPVRLTSRSDPREPAEGATQAVTVQPRFDFDLTDRLALGTELIVRRSEDPPLITSRRPAAVAAEGRRPGPGRLAEAAVRPLRRAARAQPPALHRLPRHHLHGRRPAHQHPLPRHRPLRLRRGERGRPPPLPPADRVPAHRSERRPLTPPTPPAAATSQEGMCYKTRPWNHSHRAPASAAEPGSVRPRWPRSPPSSRSAASGPTLIEDQGMPGVTGRPQRTSTVSPTYRGSGDQVFVLNPGGEILEDTTLTLELGDASADVYVIATNTGIHHADPHLKRLDIRDAQAKGQRAAATEEEYEPAPRTWESQPVAERAWVTEFNNNPPLSSKSANRSGRLHAQSQGGVAEGDRFTFIDRDDDDNRFEIPATARKVVTDGTRTTAVWVADREWSTRCGTAEKCVTQEMVDAVANRFLRPGAGNDIYDWVTGRLRRAVGSAPLLGHDSPGGGRRDPHPVLRHRR